jgi:hypothetical protein
MIPAVVLSLDRAMHAFVAVLTGDTFPPSFPVAVAMLGLAAWFVRSVEQSGRR